MINAGALASSLVFKISHTHTQAAVEQRERAGNEYLVIRCVYMILGHISV